MWAIGLMLFLLGVVLVIVAPINKKKNARCSAQTRGMLISRHKKKHGYTYVYSYHADGIEYQIKSTILSSEANQIGDSCTIWYNPNKPNAAQPFHYDSAKVYNIILVIGIVMIPLGIVLIAAGSAH